VNAPTDLLDPAAFHAWVREQILECAREHVMGCKTFAAALDETTTTIDVEAFDALAERLGIVDQRKLSSAYRRALVTSIVVEARQQAEAAMEDWDHPEGAGIAHKRLADALDRSSDHVAACDECDGRGCGDCHGGLVCAPEDVTALAIRVRDEALAALAAKPESALVPVEVPTPAREVA
jgi:hypothetical protein